MLTRKQKKVIFEVFAAETLSRGRAYWWRPRGYSMAPVVCDGERVLVAPVDPQQLRVGDVVKFVTPGGFRMHRLIWRSRRPGGALEFGFQGDNAGTPDPPVIASQIVGVAVAVERRGRIERLDSWFARWQGRFKSIRRSLREQLWRAVPSGTIDYTDVVEHL